MYEGISVKYLFSFRTIYTAFTVGAVVSELPPQADATRTNAMTAGSVLIH